ncbi:MAG TPA: hypothetical protein VGP79_04775 [Bryobacteraceae bacterium]|jgi:hypothetical protein|nr:hypothetical protein [Bryobacteraceae bacterium]
MRRLTISLLLLAIVFTGDACRSRRRSASAQVEDDGRLLTTVRMADPRGAVQLVRGFYSVEADAWRWAMKRFAVTLRTPTGSNEKGAVLELRYSLPEALLSKLGPITISATVNGLALPPETLSRAGDGIYIQEVAASALRGAGVTVEFNVDKALPPSEVDSRELALIVSSVGLLPK